MPDKSNTPRICKLCPTDISHRYFAVTMCEACADLRRIARQKAAPAWKRARRWALAGCPSSQCQDCQTDISHRRLNAVRCEQCALTFRVARAKAGARIRSGIADKIGKCRTCQISIEDLRYNVRYCPSCRAERMSDSNRQSKERRKSDPEVRAHDASCEADYVRTRKKKDPSYRSMLLEHSIKYKTRKRGQLGKVSKGIKQALQAAQGNKCAYCKVSLKKVKPHLDHILPLALGGMHDDSNLQVTCARLAI